jgi:RNA polymerase-binding transcription factor DksA
MDTEKLSVFKKRLEEELSTVEQELGTVGVQNPENPNDWEAKETEMDVMNSTADANEAADKLEEYAENRAINDTLEIRYNNIKRALEKISDGTYGICEISGEPIEEERLMANPAARTCEAHMGKDSSLAQ